MAKKRRTKNIQSPIGVEPDGLYVISLTVQERRQPDPLDLKAMFDSAALPASVVEMRRATMTVRMNETTRRQLENMLDGRVTIVPCAMPGATAAPPPAPGV